MFITCQDCSGVGCTYCDQDGLLCDSCIKPVSKCVCDNSMATKLVTKFKCRQPRRPKVGDTVILPTGDKLMFIVEIADNKKQALCNYMDDGGRMQSMLCKIEVLRYLQPFDIEE